MKYDNNMTLIIPSFSVNEGFARSVVGGFCSHLDATVEEIGDIKTAVSEAVTNCIVHGYNNGGDGLIKIHAYLQGNKVTVKIADFGQGIEDVSKAMQPFYTSSSVEERSGMGFTVMQALMSSVKVRSKRGKGTTVIMSKLIGENQAEDSEGQ